MAAEPVTKSPEGDAWLYELKLDGHRGLMIKDGNQIHIRSRNDKDLTRIYPTIAAAARRLKVDQVVIDGEIVAVGSDGKPSFQGLQHRGERAGHQILFYAFDLVHVNGRDVMAEPLVKRRARLQAIVGQDSTIRLSQNLPGSAADVVMAVRAAGTAGRTSERRSVCVHLAPSDAEQLKRKVIHGHPKARSCESL
jgi:bifunctional non-homologous end joining protein LigD